MGTSIRPQHKPWKLEKDRQTCSTISNNVLPDSATRCPRKFEYGLVNVKQISDNHSNKTYTNWVNIGINIYIYYLALVHMPFHTYESNLILTTLYILGGQKLTVRQPKREGSKCRWKARVSEHHSNNSRAAFWNPPGDCRCCNDISMTSVWYIWRLKDASCPFRGLT